MTTYLTPKITNEMGHLRDLADSVLASWDLFLRTADRRRIEDADAELREAQRLIKEIRSDLGLEETFTAEAEEPQEVCS